MRANTPKTTQQNANMNSDLLQPTLNDSHDVGGIHSPWNPKTLLLYSFFLGPLAGGILFIANCGRLGLGRLKWRVIAMTLFLVVASMASLAGLLHYLESRDRLQAPAVTIEDMSDPEKRQRVLDSFMRDYLKRVETRDARVEERKKWTRPHRYLWQALGLLGLYAVARPQWARFRLAEFHDVRPGRFLWPAVGAAVIGLSVQYSLALAVTQWF